MWGGDYYFRTDKSTKFFFITLKTQPPEKVVEMFQRLRSDGKRMLQNIIELAYFMRGSVQYNDLLLTMSFGERDLISEFISKRLEQESKSMSPNY